MRTTRFAAGLAAAALVLFAIVYLPLPPAREAPERESEFALERNGNLFDVEGLSEEAKKEEGHAWEVFEWWYGQRAYPNALIPKSAFWDAWVYARENLAPPDDGPRGASTWTSIGPDNIGGRMLAVVLDPGNPETVWAGAASGGLWKSTTGGEGASAWTRIETGFPSLSVSAIVIEPANPNVMYLGTGEISRYERPLVGTPGARSSYGLGILKSTDAGATWFATGLTWTFDQSRAVLSMRMDPTNSQILWAATSEGLYKTTDGGTSWTLSHAELMAMDVVLDPTNPSVVYVSHGQLGVPAAPDAGIYKTTNGGSSWTQLGGGLPTTDFGRTPLAISANGSRIWAGVSDASTRKVVGLYRSTNGGSSWSNVNSTNWASFQAWYDNIVGVSPHDQDLVICAGLDCYRSTNGGSNLSQVTAWYLGYDGVVPAGGSEGPSDYVHADQHGVAFHPTDPGIIYIACDGGIFKSENGGVDWFGTNGGLRTTQFYAGFANGYSTPALALGGLQDNGTIKYEGTDSWNKVFGGDGGWCAIDPTNENVLYEEYVYLNIHKSTNGGSSWNEIHEGQGSSGANFIAPFVLAESSPNILYAGTRSVKKSTNGGSSWFYPDGDSNWNGTPVATIGVSFTDAGYVMAGTGNSGASPTIEIRRTTNGGASWTDVSSTLPDRYPTDFGYDPNDRQNVWATFSGYGTGHVFRSTDAGLTWADASGNLPDIPVQAVAVDPLNADWVYVGTDLGVYRTTNGGGTWLDYNAGMPLAMVLDLVIKRDDRLLRAGTFGNGVYEIDLPDATTGVEVVSGSRGSRLELAAPQPNPFRDTTTLRFSLARGADVRLTIHDTAGRIVRTLVDGPQAAGSGSALWDGRDERGVRVAAGVYFVRLAGDGRTLSSKLTRLR